MSEPVNPCTAFSAAMGSAVELTKSNVELNSLAPLTPELAAACAVSPRA